jgi:hypothetical protein
MGELFALMPGTESPSRAVIEHFNLEHGAAALAVAFAHVECRKFDNDLHVTEVQPVLDYLESTQDATVLAPAVLKSIRQTVEASIAEQGAFRIRKSTGVFVARR